MTQTVWNTAQGRLFEFTNPDGIDTVSRLAFHADFILIIFAPLYWVWESPKVLLLSQAVIVGSGGFLVYLLSQTLINKKNISLLFACAYLINPALSWSVLFDFHPVVLATPLLLATVYFLTRKRYRWFLIFAILAGLTKEQVWLTIALFGPVLFYIHKKKVLGFLVFAISIGLFYFLTWHAIPYAASSQGHFALSYFGEGADSPTELIKDSILSPARTFGILIEKERVGYMLSLLIPLGFLSLVFPFWLLFAIGDLALNLLSSKPELHQIYFHYTAIITPFLFISAIYGVKTLNRVFEKHGKFINAEKLIAGYLFVASLLGAYIYGPLPGTLNPNDEMFIEPVAKRSEMQSQLAKIPAQKSVAASNELGAQLSHRQNIYTLGIDVREADYVAFFTHDPDPSEQQDNNLLIDQLTHDPDYQLWYQKHNLIIFKKK